MFRFQIAGRDTHMRALGTVQWEELGNIVAMAIPLGGAILQSDVMALCSEACLGMETHLNGDYVNAQDPLDKAQRNLVLGRCAQDDLNLPLDSPAALRQDQEVCIPKELEPPRIHHSGRQSPAMTVVLCEDDETYPPQSRPDTRRPVSNSLLS